MQSIRTYGGTFHHRNLVGVPHSIVSVSIVRWWYRVTIDELHVISTPMALVPQPNYGGTPDSIAWRPD